MPTIIEIFSVLWGGIVTAALIYNRLFGKFSLGDETLFSLDKRYEQRIQVAILEAQKKEREFWQGKLEESEQDSNRKLKAQADEHNQSIEALEAKNAGLQEKTFQLINKVNTYLEGIVALERLNSANEIKIMRLETSARKSKDALEAAKDVARQSNQALSKEREERKRNESALTQRIDSLQEELKQARQEVSAAELEKARLRGMIEGVSYQRGKESKSKEEQ